MTANILHVQEYFNKNAARVKSYREIAFVQDGNDAPSAATPENVIGASAESITLRGPLYNGLSVQEDVTLVLKMEGAVGVRKGSLILENPRDVDGFSIAIPSRAPLYAEIGPVALKR